MNLQAVRKLDPLHRLAYWITEREHIRRVRQLGASKPWTDDPILQSYRFCNVQREHDKVTLWIASHWRAPLAIMPEVCWFYMLMARLFNLPSTLAVLPVDADWSVTKTRRCLRRLRRTGNTVFNGAYIVSTNGVAMDKIEYVLRRVLVPAWERRATITPQPGDTLAAFAKRLLTLNGVSGFMAGQVIADTKYTPVLLNAADWYTWAASGPGSRRGMNRLHSRPVGAAWRESDWQAKLEELRWQLPVLLHAQDAQNCLCEWDKYERMLWGQGKPKRKYSGV
jgi:hypothetical protein